jgi:hypothetical protein
MGADPSTCPSARTLERLLAEQLTGAERDSVETHVELCAPCQGQLESLVATALRQMAPDAPRPTESGPEPGENFLSRLKELAPPRADRSRTAPVPPPSAVGSQPSLSEPTWVGPWLENGRLGQYEVLGKLGKGGMGAVFKARHTELGKLVALKVLPAEHMDEVGIARFKNEVRAIGKLDHPNIVVAHDAGESRGAHFLVMEFVDGMDLARVVARHGRLTTAEACEAVRQAALGLQHAYERGLVHRDVKPPNLILARDGRVRLLDLGLARSFGEAAADPLTAQGTLLGTADYLAPEQWDHPHAADTRADIYSLGCTLYHLLAGRPPFSGPPYTSVLSKMRAHLEVPPQPIERYCPEAPAGLVAALGRMLAKDPADRFATPAEVAAALQPFTPGADLGRLLNDAAPAGAATADATTPAPGAWETNPERHSHRRWSAAPARRRAFPVALAGLCLLAAAGLLPWLGSGGQRSPAAKPLDITELRLTHYRDKGSKPVGVLWTNPAAVRVEDDVRVAAKFSAPAYCYLIAFNPDGKEQLCHPEDDQGEGAPAVPPGKRAEVQYPGDNHAFVLDEAGLQVFVLAASPKPLRPYQEWRARAGAIPWEEVRQGGAWGWHFDGRKFDRFPRERGRAVPREGVPPPLQQLRDWFTSRAEFDAVQIVAFPVGKRPE